MKKQSPLVSILICTYNAERFITETVESVLGQTYTEFELLILDNASTDGTLALLHKMEHMDKRIRIFQSKRNLGPYGGLNHLLDKAKGAYIAINDHDDIWHPEKLGRQIDFLEKNPGYIGCGTAIINWYQKYDKYLLRMQPREHVLAWHTSLVYRKTDKRYDISVPIGTDFHFMKSILCDDKKSIYNIQDPLVLRRIWKDRGNLTSNWIREVNLKQILKIKLPLIDKMALLVRFSAPRNILEYIYVNFFWRHDVIYKDNLYLEGMLQ